LVQNRTDDFGASFAHLRRKYLQPLPQVLATIPASTCNRPCKYLHQSSGNMQSGLDSIRNPALTMLYHIQVNKYPRR
ncbi:MAG: hypothetical protein ACI3XV_08355, partial [Bacteroidaceae bacterium]